MKFKDRLKIAGKEALRGNLGNALKSFTIDSSSYRGDGGFWFFSEDGREVHFDAKAVNSSLTAYTDCAPVTAIINRKAQAYINGKTWLTNTQGKAKGKEATGEIANKVKNLLKKPNPIQSWRQFEAQGYIYRQIRGFNVVLPIKPVGFPNTDATALWNIPPWMLNIIEKPFVDLSQAKSIKDFIQQVSFVWGGKSTPLNLDDIFIFKDFAPSSISLTLPESRIWSLRQPINNIIGTYESRGVLINRRGPMYVISSNKSDESGNLPLTTGEKDDVQKDFAKYGLKRNQMQSIITSANISLQTVGFSTKDLMMFEEIEDDVMRVCDSYNYPYRLLSSSKSNSLGGSDIESFKKLLYQDAIIPEAESDYEQWQQFFNLDEANIKIEKDYKHVSALQEDQVQEATARYQRNRGALMEFQNNVITLNMWRELNGDDPLENDLGDLYYYELVARGVVFAQGMSGSSVPDNQGISSTTDNNNNNNAGEIQSP